MKAKKRLIFGVLLVVLLLVFVYRAMYSAAPTNDNEQASITATVAPALPITTPANVKEIPQPAATPIPAEDTVITAAQTDATTEECASIQVNPPEVIEPALIEYMSAWRQHDNPDKRFVNALFNHQLTTQEQVQMLSQLWQQQPESGLLTLALIERCSEELVQAYCPERLINQAVVLHGDNSAIWLQLASYYAVKGDEQGFVEAIVNGSQANRFNSYHAQALNLFVDTMRGNGIANLAEQVVWAMGQQASGFLPMAALSSQCRESASRDIKLAHYCLKLGEQLAKHGDTMLMQLFGFGLQLDIYQHEQNQEAIRLTEQKQQAMLQAISSEKMTTAILMMLENEALLHQWLGQIEHFGEYQASVFLTEEVDKSNKAVKFKACQF